MWPEMAEMVAGSRAGEWERLCLGQTGQVPLPRTKSSWCAPGDQGNTGNPGILSATLGSFPAWSPYFHT